MKRQNNDETNALGIRNLKNSLLEMKKLMKPLTQKMMRIIILIKMMEMEIAIIH